MSPIGTAEAGAHSSRRTSDLDWHRINCSLVSRIRLNTWNRNSDMLVWTQPTQSSLQTPFNLRLSNVVRQVPPSDGSSMQCSASNLQFIVDQKRCDRRILRLCASSSVSASLALIGRHCSAQCDFHIGSYQTSGTKHGESRRHTLKPFLQSTMRRGSCSRWHDFKRMSPFRI